MIIKSNAHRRYIAGIIGEFVYVQELFWGWKVRNL